MGTKDSRRASHVVPAREVNKSVQTKRSGMSLAAYCYSHSYLSPGERPAEGQKVGPAKLPVGADRFEKKNVQPGPPELLIFLNESRVGIV